MSHVSKISIKIDEKILTLVSRSINDVITVLRQLPLSDRNFEVEILEAPTNTVTLTIWNRKRQTYTVNNDEKVIAVVKIKDIDREFAITDKLNVYGDDYGVQNTQSYREFISLIQNKIPQGIVYKQALKQKGYNVSLKYANKKLTVEGVKY